MKTVTDENIEGLGTVKCLYVCMCARLSCHVSVAAVPVRERHRGSGLAELSVSLCLSPHHPTSAPVIPTKASGARQSYAAVCPLSECHRSPSE